MMMAYGMARRIALLLVTVIVIGDVRMIECRYNFAAMRCDHIPGMGRCRHHDAAEKYGEHDQKGGEPVLHRTRRSSRLFREQPNGHPAAPSIFARRSSAIGIGWNALTLDRPVLPTGMRPVSDPSGASASRKICPNASRHSR
jgi:hypothetical protein